MKKIIVIICVTLGLLAAVGTIFAVTRVRLDVADGE